MDYGCLVTCKQEEATEFELYSERHWEPMLVDKSGRDMIKFRNLKNHSVEVHCSIQGAKIPRHGPVSLWIELKGIFRSVSCCTFRKKP